LIQIDNVSKRFPGGHDALRGLSLWVDKGEMVFVTGHSGAGKSTLLRLIALIERPTSGQVIVNGQNTSRVSRRKIPAYRRQIGISTRRVSSRRRSRPANNSVLVLPGQSSRGRCC